MPLRSKLMRGDRALEACLVLDPAHITAGAVGDHVRKIQRALLLLDDADIAREDVLSKRYGSSTAFAVLTYKKKRSIVNFSYQTQADNIVGRMTITALDQEMFIAEARSVGRPSCGDEIGGGKGTVTIDLRGSTASASSFTQRQQLRSPLLDQIVPKTLTIHWQRTSAVSADANNRFLTTILPRAGELVSDFSMLIVNNPDASSATVPYPERITVDHTDAHLLRKAAEKAFAGSPQVLRVILCPIDDAKAFAFTSGQGFDPFQKFPNYVLINSNKARDDKGTLAHEMIHAATNLPEEAHDPDLNSIFSKGVDRRELKPAHAVALNQSFFAS